MAKPNWRKFGSWFKKKAMPVLAKIFEFVMWNRKNNG